MQGFVTLLAMVVLSTTGFAFGVDNMPRSGWCLTGEFDAPPSLAKRLDNLPASLGLPSVNELFGLKVYEARPIEPAHRGA